jgi:nucleotide-binding universal stress UspA family protein
MFDQFEHVLLPLDFSDKNEVALRTAHDILTARPVKLTLIHVIEPIAVADDVEIRNFTEQLRSKANEELKKRAQQFSDLDITVHCETLIGNRSRSTVSYAEEHGVDLILVSSHQISEGHSARSMASVSYQVAVLATCPVLLLK